MYILTWEGGEYYVQTFLEKPLKINSKLVHIGLKRNKAQFLANKHPRISFCVIRTLYHLLW